MNRDGPTRARRGGLGCVSVLAVLLLAAFVAFKVYEYRFEMGRLPANLTAVRSIYEAEKVWGLGPGGNETGVIVYEMGEDDARQLLRAVPLLSDDASIRAALGKSERTYGEWRRTPVDVQSEAYRWGQEELPKGARHPPRIREYLDVYGFGIPVDDAVETMIDRVIGAPGAFYAYGRGGSIIVVAPANRRVIYAFAG